MPSPEGLTSHNNRCRFSWVFPRDNRLVSSGYHGGKKKKKSRAFCVLKCPAFNAPVIAGNNCSCSYTKKISAGYYMWFLPHHGALSYL